MEVTSNIKGPCFPCFRPVYPSPSSGDIHPENGPDLGSNFRPPHTDESRADMLAILGISPFLLASEWPFVFLI